MRGRPTMPAALREGGKWARRVMTPGKGPLAKSRLARLRRAFRAASAGFIPGAIVAPPTQWEWTRERPLGSLPRSCRPPPPGAWQPPREGLRSGLGRDLGRAWTQLRSLRGVGSRPPAPAVMLGGAGGGSAARGCRPWGTGRGS